MKESFVCIIRDYTPLDSQFLSFYSITSTCSTLDRNRFRFILGFREKKLYFQFSQLIPIYLVVDWIIETDGRILPIQISKVLSGFQWEVTLILFSLLTTGDLSQNCGIFSSFLGQRLCDTTNLTCYYTQTRDCATGLLTLKYRILLSQWNEKFRSTR